MCVRAFFVFYISCFAITVPFEMPKSDPSPAAILLVSCPDRSGIVAGVTRFLHEHRGNIVDVDQHVDQKSKTFFMRIEWELTGFELDRAEIAPEISALARDFSMIWELHFSNEKPRVGLLVTKDNHCLYDLLSRYENGELQMKIPLIVSNREELEPVANRFSIPFFHYPITAKNKTAQEKQEIKLLREHDCEAVVLARYMQILSRQVIDAFPHRIINIHHSCLPAFPGARPYHSAYERGVKLIGATSHYVTEDLDEGPIIAQGVTPVTHRDTVKDLIRKGRDLEKTVLSRAVWLHINRRTLVSGNRTVVFG